MVVSQPSRFATALMSARLTRNHASCTASSASLKEPSIRKATARRWLRLASNCSASHSRWSVLSMLSLGHIPSFGFVIVVTREPQPM